MSVFLMAQNQVITFLFNRSHLYDPWLAWLSKHLGVSTWALSGCVGTRSTNRANVLRAVCHVCVHVHVGECGRVCVEGLSHYRPRPCMGAGGAGRPVSPRPAPGPLYRCSGAATSFHLESNSDVHSRGSENRLQSRLPVPRLPSQDGRGHGKPEEPSVCSQWEPCPNYPVSR